LSRPPAGAAGGGGAPPALSAAAAAGGAGGMDSGRFNPGAVWVACWAAFCGAAWAAGAAGALIDRAVK
jgi:hypothetical protein